MNTWLQKTLRVAEVPRVTCVEHGVDQLLVPCAEGHSRPTALFEAIEIDETSSQRRHKYVTVISAGDRVSHVAERRGRESWKLGAPPTA